MGPFVRKLAPHAPTRVVMRPFGVLAFLIFLVPAQVGDQEV